MQASLFYEARGNNQEIPLLLIAKNEWEQQQNKLSSFERNICLTHNFKGQLGEICLITNTDGLVSKAYVGIGEDNIEQAIAYAGSLLPSGCYCLPEGIAQTALVNWSLGQYRFLNYKKDEETRPRKLSIKDEHLQTVLAEAQAIFLVRDLINSPTNNMGPEELAVVVEELATKFGANFQQIVGKDLLTHNFPAIYAVGAAAAAAPRLLSLTWGDPSHPKVSLIGKGVCFDSGGLDIKPAPFMRLMKKDMAGAAHVIGLAQWIMQCQLPIYLEVLIPAIENAIGPASYRPGDILTMRNGLRVEIDNTDAEGRLILADALFKACENNPEVLINFATLTGAARVALGTEIAAFFSNSEHLAQDLADVSQKVQDPIWRLPLYAEYNALLNSTIAELVNSNPNPYGGAITAALFLQRFIPDSIAWAHFDIMAWNILAKPGKPEGGEAMGLRTVMHYLLKNYAF